MRIILIFVGLIALGAVAVLAYMLLGAPASNVPSDVASEEARPAPAAVNDLAASVPAMGERDLPTFDIVRVDRTGEAVMAGRAQPSETIRVLANGEVIGETVADGRGEWTLIVTAPLDQGDQEIILTATDANGRTLTSTQVVVVAVPDRPDAPPLVVLSSPDAPSRVLQGPQDGVRQGALVLSSVDYDDEGNVIFAGEAEPGAAVRVYVGDRSVGATRADEDGNWSLQPRQAIAPGLYTLRVDLLNENDGTARERIEVPFERAAPADIILRGGRVVVQPGNSLWRIARAVYGEGIRYTVIYEANQDQIRDADLIYPGQIFDVPSRN